MGTGHLPNDDAAWLDRVVRAQHSVATTPALERQILQSFDALTARRQAGLAAALQRLKGRFRDAVWPGVPAWKPASVLACSLLIGAIVGMYLPVEGLRSEGGEQTASVVFDAPPTFELGETSS
jgi:hypothetical protein